MARKNPLSPTREKRSQLNIGWFHRGNWLMTISAITHANAEQRIVSSKKIGTNAGTVAQSVGFPCTTVWYSISDG